MRRAAMPFEGLGLVLVQVGVETQQPLHAVIAALPNQGLVAALEDEQGRRALSPVMRPREGAATPVIVTMDMTRFHAVTERALHDRRRA